jgi:glycosyltransferase involved in cell wall biosynthesis
MRIALVTYALQIGGIETFLKLLAKYFIEKGHDVDFIETLTKGKWSRSFEDNGNTVIRILPSPIRSALWHAQKIAEVLGKYDIIILNDSPRAQAVLGLLSEEIVAIAVVHSTMTSMIRNATANLSQCDAIVGVSPLVMKALIQYGADKHKVVSIPNGITVSNSWPKQENNFDPSNHLRLVYVGAINHLQKGVLHIPGIVKKTLERTNNLTLAIIGDGPDLPELRQEVITQCPSLTVTFYGALNNEATLQLLQNSDVLLMPSYFEGLPIVLLEAMASGVVPIASNLEGCTDKVIKDNANGFLIPVGDETGFSKVIYELAVNRKILREASFVAWKTIKNEYSYVHTGSAYEELINRLRGDKIKVILPTRSGVVEKSVLGDFPRVPKILVRPVRKMLRLVGLFPPPQKEPLLFNPK